MYEVAAEHALRSLTFELSWTRHPDSPSPGGPVGLLPKSIPSSPHSASRAGPFPRRTPAQGGVSRIATAAILCFATLTDGRWHVVQCGPGGGPNGYPLQPLVLTPRRGLRAAPSKGHAAGGVLPPMHTKIGP